MKAPAEQRAEYMTVGMALKLAHLTIAQACEQAYRDTELMLREQDAIRQHTEDLRSRRRNRNRLLVLAIGISMAWFWPWLMTVTGLFAMIRWTTMAALCCEAIETAYAYFREY